MRTDGDYISREALLSATEGYDWQAGLKTVLKRIPAADVWPVRRGKWKNNHCSACGMMPMGEEMWECCDFTPPKFEWFMNFCPNCGADMRGESDA